MNRTKKILIEKLKEIFAVLAFYLMMFCFILVGLYLTNGEVNSSFYTVLGIMGCFILIFLVLIIILVSKDKKEKKAVAEQRMIRLQQDPEERLETLLQETDETIGESRRERLGKTKGRVSLLQEKKYQMVNYTGQVQNKVCAICKLELRKRQKIMQCTKCLNLFHEKHIMAWLEKNELCPVCNESLVEFIDLKE